MQMKILDKCHICKKPISISEIGEYDAKLGYVCHECHIKNIDNYFNKKLF